jgi:hypothetical protein
MLEGRQPRTKEPNMARKIKKQKHFHNKRPQWIDRSKMYVGGALMILAPFKSEAAGL